MSLVLVSLVLLSLVLVSLGLVSLGLVTVLVSLVLVSLVLLPLSRAVCCTLAPPAAPAQPNATTPGELLAVGCEPAVSAGSGRPMMCPAGMLATGFEGARFLDEHLVKSEYYPTGGAMCCRIGLSGGAGAPHVRVVEPCNCERRGMQDVGCGVH